jgi:hypothetical protein
VVFECIYYPGRFEDIYPSALFLLIFHHLISMKGGLTLGVRGESRMNGIDLIRVYRLLIVSFTYYHKQKGKKTRRRTRRGDDVEKEVKETYFAIKP